MLIVTYSIIAEAQRRFGLYKKGEIDAIHPNLRYAVFRIIASKGGKDVLEAFMEEYEKSTSVDGKEIILQSLGRVSSPMLATEYLDFLFSSKVAIQDIHSGAAALAANLKTRHALWVYVKSRWDDNVYPKLSRNTVVLDRFLRITLTNFAEEEVADDIKDFFDSKDNTGYDRCLGVIQDTIRSNAAYKKRDLNIIQEWLSAHGYM